jgi:hypothetical protein
VPAVLRVRRELSPWQDRARKYKVLVDDEHVGSVANGDTFEVAVAPGPHTLRLKIDWKGSRELHFVAGDDGIHDYVCDATGLDLRVRTIFTGGSDYIDLRAAHDGDARHGVGGGAQGSGRDPRAFPRAIIPPLVLMVVVLLFVPRVVGLPLLLLAAWYVRRVTR